MVYVTPSSIDESVAMTTPLAVTVNNTMPVPQQSPGGLALFPDMSGAGANLQGTVSWSLWVFFVLATALVALRMYCKYLKYRSYTLDDWLLVAAWAVFFAGTVLSLVLVGRGQGKHVWDIPPEVIPTFALPGRLTSTLQAVALAWSKTSFAITLLRVVPQKLEKWFLFFAMITLNAIVAVSALLPWISCEPLQKSWKPEIPGVCNFPPVEVATTINISTGAYSGLLDLVFVFLAWKTVLFLQMELREKIAVGLAMSMGIFAAVCAVIKCTQLPNLSDPDFTYKLSPIIIWSAAEASATIMAACVPSLRVLAYTARSKVKEKLARRSRSRDVLYGLRSHIKQPSVQASATTASRVSTRPELRSQLSFERWAMGENEVSKEARRLPANVIYVDRTIRLDWEPVQTEKGDMEKAMALDSITEVAS